MLLGLTKQHLTLTTTLGYNQHLQVNIDFNTHEVSIAEEDEQKLKEVTILGIVGMTKLNAATYLIVASQASEVGRIDGAAVFKLERIVFVPLSYAGASGVISNLEQSQFVKRSSSSVDLIMADEKASLASSLQNLVKVKEWQDRKIIYDISGYFCNGTFFYSLECDITNSEQRKLYRPRSQSMFGHLDGRFWFNKHLAADFLVNSQYERFVIPLMQGYVGIVSCEIEKHMFDYVLISRRSVHRNGLRYLKRGVDIEGNVANFVETEQKVKFHGSAAEVADSFLNPRHQKAHIASFVQIRGSVPICWTQNPQSRKPVPELRETPEVNTQALNLHFQQLRKLYGLVNVVTLIEQEGREGILQQAFTKYMGGSYDVEYTEFDVHQECKGMKYENLQKLMNQLQVPLTENIYFWRSDDTVLTSQKGVIRTNCVDCLDRTNVVQSLFARHVLNNQLLRLGVHTMPSEGLAAFADFEKLFQSTWADNGDAISLAYTNTSALKGDVTRTGKRQWMGLLNDGGNSLYRLFQNNFLDNSRQSIIDYFLGVISYEQFTGQVNQELQEEQDYEVANTSTELRAAEVIRVRKDALDQAKSILLLPGQIAVAEEVVLSFQLRAGAYDQEENIFLLSAEVLYIAHYHIQLDKITAFKSIPLDKITQIRKGPISLSKDFSHLYGIAVYYMSDGKVQLANTFNYGKRTPQAPQEQFEFFAVSDKDFDHSQLLAEQIVARLASLVLAIPEHERVSSKKEFVLDSDIEDLLPKKNNLMAKMRNLFQNKTQLKSG